MNPLIRVEFRFTENNVLLRKRRDQTLDQGAIAAIARTWASWIDVGQDQCFCCQGQC